MSQALKKERYHSRKTLCSKNKGIFDTGGAGPLIRCLTSEAGINEAIGV
jgi:hypothetical protein